MWQEATRLEDKRDFLASSRILEEIVRLTPTDPRPYWRIAKNYIELADALPLTKESERNKYFTMAEEWADRGLGVDPECGECCLYRVGGLGGRLRKGGMLAAASEAPQIAELLERGIALLSQRPDHDVNPELEELYYAAAQFYRAVPEWPWLKWVLGVRGSRRRAVEYMRKANEISTNISGPRPDYLVELGASLLCLGEHDKEPALVAEGLDTLQRVILLERNEPTGSVDAQHAGILIADPREACDYSRYEWINKQQQRDSTGDAKPVTQPERLG
jgi:tetratricopeptide (TPR) repeat protein